MPDEEIETIIAVPVKMPGCAGSKGGYFCAQCGREVQLAPSSRSFMLGRQVRIICMVCCLKKAAETKEPIEGQLIPGSIEELREWIGKQHGRN